MRKYGYYKLVTVIGIGAFFCLQCEKTYLPVDSDETIDYLQGNTQARVIIKMFDLHSMAPLKNVNVEITGIGSSTSDTSGAVAFDSVHTGTYLITCTKDGYAGIFDNLTLSIDSNSSTVPVVSQSTDMLFMARKGAVIRGNLYYRKEGEIHQVDDATLECRLTNSSIEFQKPLEITTSDDGSYTFNDLPEYSTYTIHVQSFNDGSSIFKQTGTVSSSGQAVGDTLRINDIILEKYTDGNFIIMSHNLEKFTYKDSLMFEFSEAVDIDKLGHDSIYIALKPSDTRVLVHQIWRNDDQKLFIIPFDGTWDNNQNYTLVIRKIVSTTGTPLDNTEYLSYDFSPLVTGDLDDVEDLRVRVGSSDTNKVDYNTSSILLRWSRLDNAASYQIYQKSSSDSSWILNGTANDTFATVTTTGEFNLGNQLKLIVLGVNSTSSSSFEDATVLTLKDEKQPIITLTNTRSGFNNSSGNSLDTIEISISNSYLPEPMDTTEKPSLEVIEASYRSGPTMYGDTLYAVDPDKCFWTWTSDRSGIMNVVVDEHENGAYDSLKIDFSSVPDWAGNEPDTSNGSGYIYIHTRP